MKNNVTLIKSLFALGTALVFAAPVLAQTPATSPVGQKAPHEKHQAGKRFAALEMTADQKAKMKAIEKDSHAKMKVLKADTTLTPEQKKAKAKEIHQGTRAALMNILTPEQKQKLTAQMKERKGKKGILRSQATPAPKN